MSSVRYYIVVGFIVISGSCIAADDDTSSSETASFSSGDDAACLSEVEIDDLSGVDPSVGAVVARRIGNTIITRLNEVIYG